MKQAYLAILLIALPSLAFAQWTYNIEVSAQQGRFEGYYMASVYTTGRDVTSLLYACKPGEGRGVFTLALNLGYDELAQMESGVGILQYQIDDQEVRDLKTDQVKLADEMVFNFYIDFMPKNHGDFYTEIVTGKQLIIKLGEEHNIRYWLDGGRRAINSVMRKCNITPPARFNPPAKK